MNHQHHMIKELKQNRPRRAEEHAKLAKLIWHLKTGGVLIIPKHANFDRLEKSGKNTNVKNQKSAWDYVSMEVEPNMQIK